MNPGRVARRRVLSAATWIGNLRLEGVAALVFVLATLALASLARWFVIGEFNSRELFPAFLLAAFISTWVVGVNAGVFVTVVTALLGLVVFGGDASGLTHRDLIALGFVILVCASGVALVGRARFAHDQLRTERRWFQALLDHSTEAIGFVAANGTLRYLNRSARMLWGVGDEVIDRPMAEVLSMRRLDQTFVLDTRPRAQSTPGLHCRLPEGLSARQNGSWVAVSGQGTWIKRGHYGEGLVFSLQWNEALRQATSQLEATRQHLDALLDANVVGVAVLDAEGGLSCPNRAFLAMVGVGEGTEAARGLRLDELLMDPTEFASDLGQSARDTQIRNANGSTSWVSLTLASSGANQGLLLATRIDDRKHAEREATFRRILLQTIIDEVPALIAFVRPDGCAEFASQHARTAIGEELVGVSLEEQLSGGLWSQLQPALQRAWAGEVSQLLLILDSPSHEARYLQSQLTPHRAEGGEIEGVVWHAFDVTERLQREQSLVDSEYRFRRLAESFSSVVWQATETGDLLSTFGWEEFTGVEPKPTMREWASAVHADDVPVLRAFIAQMSEFTQPSDVELRLAHRDGGYRHVALKGLPLEDEAQPPRRWIGCIRDIHTRRVYASALAARESELRLILETVPARLAYLNPQSELQWCNRAFAEWFCIHPNVHGEAISVLLPEEVMSSFRGALARAQNGQQASVEWTYLHPELGLRWSTTTFTSDLEPDGRVRGVITLCMDCTDRHEREASLRRSVAEHQALVENVPQMVWMADPQGKVEYFNQRWYEFTLLLDSASWTAAIHPHERAQAEEAFDRARATGTEFSIEVRYRRGDDGQFRWHLVRATPLCRDDGSIIRWYGTCTDIEDQKVAQQTLQEAQSRTDQFLATLSHELRNPLAALVANSYLLDLSSPAHNQWQDASATIRRQAVHLKRLVDDLLDISRITLGKVRLNSQLFDVGALCGDACRDFSEVASTHGVDLGCDVPDEALWMMGDPARIRQCIDNLVSNAIKASFEKGRVRISTRAKGEVLEIAVEDEGVGIPSDLLRGIFHPFAQGDAWRQTGLGLGLSIVRKMVELHGGRVRADSAGPGFGARFTVSLPFDPSLAPAVEPEKPAQRSGERRKGKVMLVDDEQDSARALGYLLEMEGHEVHTVADGATALRLALHLKPQIVVCDIGLPPPLDGLQVAERLLANAEQPSYLIAYSGYGTTNDVERSLRSGFNVHLTKPCNPAVLIAEIDKGLQALASGASEQPEAPAEPLQGTEGETP